VRHLWHRGASSGCAARAPPGLGAVGGVRRSGERGWKEIVGLRPGDRVVVDGRQSVPAARAHGASAGCSAIASGSAPTGSPRWRSGLSVIVVQKRWLATGFRTLVHATPPRSPSSMALGRPPATRSSGWSYGVDVSPSERLRLARATDLHSHGVAHWSRRSARHERWWE